MKGSSIDAVHTGIEINLLDSDGNAQNGNWFQRQIPKAFL
jgi:hypothetical protein